jgi:hypothetical protein
MLKIQNLDGTDHPLDSQPEGWTIKSWPWIEPGPLDARGYPGAVLVDLPEPEPPPFEPPPAPTKAQLLAELQKLAAKIEAMP